MAMYANGQQVSGCTSYASAVNYIEEDGSKSTVQDKISELSSNLTNENSETFNFGIKDGVRGYYTNPSRADDCFIPFKMKSPSNYIYNKGDLCYELSGGWYSLDVGYDFLEDGIYTTWRQTGNSNATISTVSPIDCSLYNKLIVKGKFMQHGTYGGFSFGLTNSKTAGQGGAVRQVSSYRFPTTTNKFEDLELELDISNINNKLHVFIRPYYGPCDIYEVYFE
jgi:hypothetical protein